MEHFTIEELREQVEQIWEEPEKISPSEIDKLIVNILWNEYLEKNQEKSKKYRVLIKKVRAVVGMDLLAYAKDVHSIAFDMYNQRKYKLSEILFREAVSIEDTVEYRNNLAYVLRKYSEKDNLTKREVIQLLVDGVKEQEPFCLVNMALFLAVELNTLDDWKTADRIIALLPEDIYPIITWWNELANKGDSEGYLLELWLLRHRKISRSRLGTKEYLDDKVKKDYPTVPGWIFIEIKDSKNLESFILDNMCELDFEQRITEYLDAMPENRISVEEIMRITKLYDILELYVVLFGKLKPLLSIKEFNEMKKEYELKFDIPISDII